MPRQLEFWEDGEPGKQSATTKPAKAPHPPKSPFKGGLEEQAATAKTKEVPHPPESTFGGELEEQAATANDAPPPRLSPAMEGKKAGTVPGAKAVDPVAVEAMRAELSRLSGLHVLLKVTNNTHCLMRVAHEPGGRSAQLSLHWMFMDAPPAVIKALAGWVKHPKKIRKDSLLRDYMHGNNDRILAAKPRRVTISTKGQHYDLAELYADVNVTEFEGAITAKITWGVMLPVGRSRSGHFRLGSYNDARNLIRIHPVLDNPQVPRFVIRSIVFHEMLHASLGIKKEDGKRRKVHHSEFKRREEQYRDYKAAEAWINNPQNMRMLAKIRRKGHGA
jgi:hypothetical protein